jgi:hypothetical protein
VSDSTDKEQGQSEEGPPSSARGEAAWRAATERVAERNKAARKGGKQRREAYERQRDDSRRAAERERHAKLIQSRSSRRPPGQ